MENRDTLPFRKNCEGYFILENGEIIVNIITKNSNHPPTPLSLGLLDMNIFSVYQLINIPSKRR